jgi:predicted Rossmann fold nucleotide-binding protein DprA/Smf involved in DNA uptake
MAIPISSAKGRHFLPQSEGDQFALAVVGTRNSSTYGRQVTERIVTDLAKGQVTIVSGLALGIDTIAHTAALMGQGRIVATGRTSLFFRTPSLHATERYRNHVHRRDRYHT